MNEFRAEALQSVLQLMGEKEMFDYWSQTYRVHNLEWSQGKAADILDAWQSKFTEEVMRHASSSNETRNFNIHPFSSASLANILTEFSELSIVRVAIGYILMVTSTTQFTSFTFNKIIIFCNFFAIFLQFFCNFFILFSIIFDFFSIIFDYFRLFSIIV